MTANHTTPFLSVVIPACNPGMGHFQIVMEALRNQMLPKDRWELIVVDDASKQPLVADQGPKDKGTKGLRDSENKSGGLLVASCGSLVASGETGQEQRISSTKNEEFIDLSWHPNAKLVQTDAEREGLGLVSARLRGFELGKGDVFVFVDQDNELRPDYLQGVADIALEFPHIGTWGGQILLKFDEPEKAPADWLKPDLCTRVLTRDVWSNVTNHHGSTPIGAGLCARREVMDAYRQRVFANPMRRLLDPTPRRAGYGGDSDLAYAGCHLGYGKGAFKRLILHHLIPSSRCSFEYFVRLYETKGYSDVLHIYLEEGRIAKPRRDWKHRIMQTLRAPFTEKPKRLIDAARRRGEWAAVAELEQRPEEVRDYALRLQRKAEGLAAR